MLLDIIRLDDDTRLGLWKIDDSTEAIYSRFPHLKNLGAESLFRSKGRQKEWLAVRALLAEMTGDCSLTIAHLPSGKPIVEGWRCSISHTKGFAALILSRSKEVAVDIEWLSTRVDSIADRFMRDDERAETTIERLLVWSAKESLFKYHSADQLLFDDMRISINENTLTAENLKRGERVVVGFSVSDDYVLTFIH